MRVIGGEYRSRKLKSLAGEEIRPTPDRLRESLFNILAPEIEGAVFLDAYAGTGAVGIEALSRGASRVIFIERRREAVELIEENLTALRALGRATVLRGTVGLLLPRHHADIVFVDPPYALEKEYASALAVLAADPPKLVVVQHPRQLELGEEYGPLGRTRMVKQGDNVLSFYRPKIQERSSAE